MIAMVLAAGLGERFGSITKKIPKPMVELGGIPLIEHTIIRLRSAGFTKIIINVHWLGHIIKDFIDNRDFSGVKVHIVEEKERILGTGGGIKNALPRIGKAPFWLINSDVYTTYMPDLSKTLKDQTLGHLVLVQNPPHHQTGDFELDGDQVFQKDRLNSFTFSGMSLLSPRIFDNIAEEVFALEPVLSDLAMKKSLTGEFFEGTWIDVGNVARLSEAEKHLASKNLKSRF